MEAQMKLELTLNSGKPVFIDVRDIESITANHDSAVLKSIVETIDGERLYLLDTVEDIFVSYLAAARGTSTDRFSI
jgi:hypothetical protein